MFRELAVRLPGDVLRPLEAAGWHSGWQAEADHWIRDLEAEENRSFPAAREFLEVFGGLRFEAVPTQNRAFDPGWTSIDPIEAGSEIDRVEDWQSDHGLRLFPVGSVFDGHFVLMIAPDGKFYAGNDESLVVVGDDAIQAFRQLLYAPAHMKILES